MSFKETMKRSLEYSREVSFADGPWFNLMLSVFGITITSLMITSSINGFAEGDGFRGGMYGLLAVAFILGFGFIAWAQWVIAYLSGSIKVREEYMLKDAEARLRETYGIEG